MVFVKVIDRPEANFTCYLEFYEGRVFLHNTVLKYSAKTKREMLRVMDIIQEELKAPLYCIHSLYDIPDNLTKYWHAMGMRPFQFELDGQGRTAIVYRKEFADIGE